MNAPLRETSAEVYLNDVRQRIAAALDDIAPATYSGGNIFGHLDPVGWVESYLLETKELIDVLIGEPDGETSTVQHPTELAGVAIWLWDAAQSRATAMQSVGEASRTFPSLRVY